MFKRIFKKRSRRIYKNFFDKNKWLKRLEGWFWLIMLIVSILYFKWLLIEANLETKKLISEREQFQIDLEKQQDKTKNIQKEIHAQINNPISELISLFGDIGEVKRNNTSSTATAAAAISESNIDECPKPKVSGR